MSLSEQRFAIGCHAERSEASGPRRVLPSPDSSASPQNDKGQRVIRIASEYNRIVYIRGMNFQRIFASWAGPAAHRRPSRLKVNLLALNPDCFSDNGRHPLCHSRESGNPLQAVAFLDPCLRRDDSAMESVGVPKKTACPRRPSAISNRQSQMPPIRHASACVFQSTLRRRR